MYMMHFYNSALSILLADEGSNHLTKHCCRAIRDLLSFKRYARLSSMRVLGLTSLDTSTLY